MLAQRSQRRPLSLGSQGTPSPGASGCPRERQEAHRVACEPMHLGALGWAGPAEPETWAAAALGPLM